MNPYNQASNVKWSRIKAVLITLNLKSQPLCRRFIVRPEGLMSNFREGDAEKNKHVNPHSHREVKHEKFWPQRQWF